MVPTPNDREKKACPMASTNNAGSAILEKSGTRYARKPPDAPGNVRT